MKNGERHIEIAGQTHLLQRQPLEARPPQELTALPRRIGAADRRADAGLRALRGDRGRGAGL